MDIPCLHNLNFFWFLSQSSVSLLVIRYICLICFRQLFVSANYNLRPYLGNIFLLRLTVFFFILYGYEFINRLRQLRQISYIFNQKKIENIFWRQFLHTPYSIRMYTTVQDWVQLYGNSSEQYTALFRIL